MRSVLPSPGYNCSFREADMRGGSGPKSWHFKSDYTLKHTESLYLLDGIVRPYTLT
jgi:hypothetical protein